MTNIRLPHSSTAIQNCQSCTKLQFSSYQLADIQDSLKVLDSLISVISDAHVFHENTTPTMKRVHVDHLRVLQSACPSTMQKAKTASKLITVTRAAFVFKKTREQFAFKKYSYQIHLNHPAHHSFQNWLLTILGTTNFAAELKIVFHH